MRNAGLDRMQGCVPSAWVAKQQAVRQVMDEPGRVPVWCYLSETLDSTQVTIIVDALKASSLEQEVAVEVASGIERHALDRVLLQTGSSAVESISRVTKFTERPKVIQLKSCFRASQDHLHQAWPTNECREPDRKRGSLRNNNRMIEFNLFEGRTFE